MLQERYISQEKSLILSDIEHLKNICSGGDDGLLSDMIEGELDVESFICHVLEFILADEAAIEGIKLHARRVSERKKRLDFRVARLRTLLASVVTTLPNRKYRHALALVTAFDVDPKIVVTDESAIPTVFWIPQDPKLNESKLRHHLLERRTRLEDALK